MYKRGIFVSVKSTIGCLYKILEATTHVLMQNEVTHWATVSQYRALSVLFPHPYEAGQTFLFLAVSPKQKKNFQIKIRKLIFRYFRLHSLSPRVKKQNPSERLNVFRFGVFFMKCTRIENSGQMNKGWKFLKKLWCCIGGGNKVIWLYQVSWKCKLTTATSYKADVSSVSPSSERNVSFITRYGG